MDIAPVRLCCGKRHYDGVCPDGKVMCQLCFGRFDLEDLNKLPTGEYEDVCKGCAEDERRKGASKTGA